MVKIPENYCEITELTQMQDMLKKLMQDLHNICEKHKLIYNIAWGTLLGAVRHQDIIPWDDDIDITMPRPDYEKLIQIVQEEYSDRFEMYAYPKKNYAYPFAKFCLKRSLVIESGLKEPFSNIKLYIDIFPMDGIPEPSKEVLRKRLARADWYKKCAYCCVEKHTIPAAKWKKPFFVLKYLRTAVLGLWGYRYFVKKQVEESRKYAYEDCEHVGFVNWWGEINKGIYTKSEYLNRKLYKFGEYVFWGTADYHTSLTNWYGEYMMLPPESERVVKHGLKLYIEKDKQTT